MHGAGYPSKRAPSFTTPNHSKSPAGLRAMENLSGTNYLPTLANLVSRPRGEAPGALSHMVAANLRARALAPVVREIWAEGYMSYNAVSRELNRRQVPPLRGGTRWYPMTAGRLLVRLERTGLIRIRRPTARGSLLELASRESRRTETGDATHRQSLSRR